MPVLKKTENLFLKEVEKAWKEAKKSMSKKEFLNELRKW